MHAWSHASQSAAGELFNNTNLGNDAEDQVVSTCDSKRVAFAREIPADNFELFDHVIPERLGLYGQANKRTWWMPWR